MGFCSICYKQLFDDSICSILFVGNCLETTESGDGLREVSVSVPTFFFSAKSLSSMKYQKFTLADTTKYTLASTTKYLSRGGPEIFQMFVHGQCFPDGSKRLRAKMSQSSASHSMQWPWRRLADLGWSSDRQIDLLRSVSGLRSLLSGLCLEAEKVWPSMLGRNCGWSKIGIGWLVVGENLDRKNGTQCWILAKSEINDDKRVAKIMGIWAQFGWAANMFG